MKLIQSGSVYTFDLFNFFGVCVYFDDASPASGPQLKRVK